MSASAEDLDLNLYKSQDQNQNQNQKLSVEEYFLLEEELDQKFEYIKKFDFYRQVNFEL